MKKLIHFLFLLIVYRSNAQQDFSQFYSFPLAFNPAQTARFDGSLRMIGVFRNRRNMQSDNVSTTAISLDMGILQRFISKNDRLGVGIIMANERNLSQGIRNNSIGLSVAYQKGLDIEGSQQIGIGFQTILAGKRVDPPNVIFEDQMKDMLRSGFSSFEFFAVPKINISYFDLNVGIVYQGRISESNYFTISASGFHMNKPNRNYNGGIFSLRPSYIYNACWRKKIDATNHLYVAGLLKTENKRISSSQFGGFIEFNVSNSKALIRAGAWHKKDNFFGMSLIPNLGIESKGFTFNVSHDIRLQSNPGQQSASELSVTYRKPISTDGDEKFIRF